MLVALYHAQFGLLCRVCFLLFLSLGAARAGYITIDKVEVNRIFSQDTFGGTPVSIRFNPSVTIVAPQFLEIRNFADLQGLYALLPLPSPTIVAYFVDLIDECLQVEVVQDDGRFFGCAQKPGNYQVLNSRVAAETAKLMAHELGHNFGLDHVPVGLMTSHLGFGGIELFDDQISTILQSPLVQVDANGQRFVMVTPVAIIDTPEPSTLLLLGGGLGVLLITRRKSSERRA